MSDPLTIIHGDALSSLRELESESVQTCVTSPPYWGLRDYGHEWQIGLEKTPEEYVARLVEIFGEVKRVLRKDGTLWLNLGDSYCGSMKGWAANGYGYGGPKQRSNAGSMGLHPTKDIPGLKPKDLVGIPWMVAFALRADGWYLRSDIIWSKPNPMPESVKDRPTRSHEYIFLLSKSRKYYFDQDAVSEPITVSTSQRYQSGWNGNEDRGYVNGPQNHFSKYMGSDAAKAATTRNKRSVWEISTNPFADAHFATFPPELITPCILAGAPTGGVVLDPFAGSDTTGKVSIELGRKVILIEPKAEYIEMIKKRCQTTIGLPL